jgi:transposase
VPNSSRRDQKADALREQGALNRRAQSVTDPLFQQNAFFDARDLVQVKYEMLRRVQVDGQAVTQAAAAFGLSRPSFYEAQSAFQEAGLAGLIPKKRGPRGAHKLKAPIAAFIEQTRADDESRSPAALAELVKQRFDITVHPRSVERILASAKKKRR